MLDYTIPYNQAVAVISSINVDQFKTLKVAERCDIMRFICNCDCNITGARRDLKGLRAPFAKKLTELTIAHESLRAKC